MTPNTAAQPLLTHQPHDGAEASDWVAWYWSDLLPAWVERARDPDGPGYFDLLDETGQPDLARKSVLAQARLLFTFSHLALLSGNPAHLAAAAVAHDALAAFRKPSGLYRRCVTQSGQPTGNAEDDYATSYDQSFIILGLSTWGKLHPSEQTDPALEAIWCAIETTLIDPATGLLLEHDSLDDPADNAAPARAQNPHMHLYEATLQAFEMTQNAVWLERAKTMRAKGLEFFFDTDSGTITEFIAPDLSILPGRAGQRREIGHQCEWAWLLLREVDLGGNPDMAAVAARLLAFADDHGFAQGGVMQGLAFDAVSADADWREDRFLLWPQTEALKTYAVRATDKIHADNARRLTLSMFRHYFADRTAFVNHLDDTGAVLWPDALSRLHYHVVLALTEGARAGLWATPT
ncbi:AGE family epimerase/isomerase [Roseobacter sp.]|uniref:AGE family epimerase/isomerase n=1 Tax=Roseobacter sp. TaxID=1907202 RepID=UPI0032984426